MLNEDGECIVKSFKTAFSEILNVTILLHNHNVEMQVDLEALFLLQFNVRM